MKKILLAVIAAATVGTFMVLEWRRESEALAAKSPTVAATVAKASPAAQPAPPPPPECKVKQVEIDKKRSRRVLLREPLMPVENGHQDDDCELKTTAAKASPAAQPAPSPPECKVKQVEIDKKRSRRVLLREPLMPVENGHQDDDCELKTTAGAWTCWPRDYRVLVERCLDKDGTP